jgi:hypothetical protein
MAVADEQRILLTQATPGMVLSRPVLMQNRAALCAAGMELSESVINHLLVRGIKRIWVKGRPLPSYGEDDLRIMLERLRERFSRVQQDSFMLNLQRIIEQALVRRS